MPDEVGGVGDVRVIAALRADLQDDAGVATACASSSHSSTVTPIGFSTSTCLPAATAWRAAPTWNWSAIATITASRLGSASIAS